MILLFFAWFLSGDFVKDVDSLGLYRPELATVWQWDENYLFFEYNPARIVKVSPKGVVLSSFSQEGDGPEEIMRPVPLGFDDEYLFVISHRHRVLIFDKNLKLTNQKLPSIRSIIGRSVVWQGLKLADGTFALLYGSTGIHHSHGLVRVKHSENEWQVLNRYFPFDIVGENKNMPLPNAKNPKWQFGEGVMFNVTPTVLQSEDSYEVLFHPKPWATDNHEVPIGGLFADVEAIVSQHKAIRCFPMHVGRLKNGYVVEIAFNRGDVAHDYFDLDGGFIRRDFEDYHIVPVTNTNQTLKLVSNGDIEQLSFFGSIQ